MSTGPLSGVAALPQSVTAPRFPPSSRYANIGIAIWGDDGEGRGTPYLLRRLLPDPDTLAEIGTHTVQDGERLDTIAFAELGDPQLSWQLLDANRALAPRDLLANGRRLRVTLPAGIPGTPDA